MAGREPTFLSGFTGHRDDQYAKPLPEPEVGLRLMRAFLSIRNEALREAIIRFVEELSMAPDKGISSRR